MTLRSNYSAEASTALSSTYTVLTLDGDSEGGASPIPDRCVLSWLHGEIDTIASSAASIQWYVALDSNGDIPITDAVTETILVGNTTATDGGVSTLLDMSYHLVSSSTPGKLYVLAKTDTGTCNITVRLHWQTA
jgi:hypothetical protein